MLPDMHNHTTRKHERWDDEFMWDEDAPDWFDEVRREWITRHASNFPIQKRRAQLLNRRILDRSRRQAGARPNPHVDNAIPHVLARRASTVEGYIEAFAIATAVLTAPLGWLAGIALYRWILHYIPLRLRSYPLPALLWAAVGLGALTLGLYEPGTSLATAPIAPWFMAQSRRRFGRRCLRDPQRVVSR